MTGLYTLNLRIVGGSANVPLFNYKSVFDNDFINGIFPEALAPYKTVIIIFIIMIIAKILLDLYLKTKSGYLLRAVGDNETIVTSLAKDSGFVKIVGLAISNGLVALAGSVMCQQQRFFEISMGTGTIVIGLASVIIGTNVFKGNLIKATTAVVIGSVIYKACVAIAIEVGLLIAMFLFMKRVAETTHVSVVKDEIDLSDDGEIHHDEEVLSLPKGVEVYEIDGPFFFGVASKFDDIMHNMGDKPKIRIIRMRKVPFMDSTGLHNLENLFRLSQAEHIHMILSGVNEHVRRVLVKSGFDKKIGTENICSNINEAVAKAHEAIR